MQRLTILALCLVAAASATVNTCHHTAENTCTASPGCDWCGNHCWPKGSNCPTNAFSNHAMWFNQFKVDHDKTYDTIAEHNLRFGLFQTQMKRIAMLNADKNDTAIYGVTRWSDATEEEKYLKCGKTCEKRAKHHERMTEVNRLNGNDVHVWDGTCYNKRYPKMCDGPLPQSVDWEALGALTPIKDQGKCGNCFTFGATADFESAWFIAGNPLISLSEQHITSCDHVGGDGGCGGGDTNLDTDEWVLKNGGIALESDYPYCSGKYTCAGKTKGKRKNGVCKTNVKLSPFKSRGGYQVSGGAKHCDWCDIQPINETRVMEHLVRAGPVTIAINSGTFDAYKSGIMNPHKCQGTMKYLDHQIAIVGYGTDNGTPYWKLRNSWGTDWGEKGYARLKRGQGAYNLCGAVTDATHVLI